jgi:hypothetical protein
VCARAKVTCGLDRTGGSLAATHLVEEGYLVRPFAFGREAESALSSFSH